MKTIIKRVLCAVLILAIVFSLPTVVSAETSLTYVHAYSDADNQHRLLALVEISGSPYINANDALLLSGYEAYQEDSGKATFHYGAHKVEFKDDQKEYDGVYYYPLKELMDALSTRYYYEEATNTLIFITCSTYYENLLADCESVYLDNYTLDFYEGTGWQLAGVYEILGGMRFDVLWGGYQQEIYKEAVAGIITEADTENLSTIKQGDTVMSKLAKILNFVEKDINGIKTYEDFLGTDLDGVIKAYSLLNDLIPGISVKNAIEILEYVQKSSSSAELYSNAVAYGLINNTQISDWNLSHSADLVYAYYGNNKPTYEAVIQSLVDDVRNDILNDIPVGQITVDLIKKAVGSELGGIYINSAYVKLAKMIFDEMGMKERTSAVMQTVACRNIQEFTINQYINIRSLNSYYALEGYSAKNERAKALKYSTILYLRACQYAYSLYEFDDTLGFATNYWKEKTQAAISLISSYSDDELSLVVINKELELSGVEYYEKPGNYSFIPAVLEFKDWSAGAHDTCPTITFKEDSSCDVVFNMAEYMLECSATFEVYMTVDGERFVKVNLGNIEIEDGKTHKTPIFYLFEAIDGTWEYYGEGIGFTLVCGKTVQDTELAVGVYFPDESRDSLTIEEHGANGDISFSASWYRTADISDVVGTVYGNVVPFTYARHDANLDEYYDETVGVLEFEDGKIILTLFETTLPWIEIGSYSYAYWGSEEEVQTSYNKSVLLDMQSDERGWIRTNYYDSQQVYVEDMLIKFHNDGSVTYFVGTPWGGDVIYEKYTGTYKITHDTLYIDGQAYRLNAYTAGSSTMNLYALGEYAIDFSGDYICEVSEIFGT